jgi:hypothetical protein
MSEPVQLQPGEDVVMTIKRHPVHLWGRITLIVIVVGLILILWFNFGMGQSGFFGTVMNVLAIGSVVIGLIMAYVYWYRYNNDIWLITSHRLVDSTKSTPFSHNLLTADLLNLQDINIRQRGITQTVFQYGDVSCQTASASSDTFQFKGVKDPQEVLDQIEKARSQARDYQSGRSSAPAKPPAPTPEPDEAEK